MAIGYNNCMGNEKIRFVSQVEGLEDIEECRPKPAKHFIPKWFKDIPSNEFATVKICPSFPDFFSQGYIVPMWCDSTIQYDEEENVYSWKSSMSETTWASHHKEQFMDYVKPNFNGVPGQFIFKAICPWRVITPPGWSVLQLPLFYHFNQKWSVLPGIVDTDIHSEINQQVLYHGNGESVTIEHGEPFVLYIPFKRSNKLKLEVSAPTKKDKKIFRKHNLTFQTKSFPNGIYRKLQRKRDRDE